MRPVTLSWGVRVCVEASMSALTQCVCVRAGGPKHNDRERFVKAEILEGTLVVKCRGMPYAAGEQVCSACAARGGTRCARCAGGGRGGEGRGER